MASHAPYARLSRLDRQHLACRLVVATPRFEVLSSRNPRGAPAPRR